MLACSWSVTSLAPYLSNKRYGTGFCCKAIDLQSHANGDQDNEIKKKKKKKVVIVGSGWAGLGAAHHLCNQVISLSLSLPFCLFVCFMIYFCCRLFLNDFISNLYLRISLINYDFLTF